MLQKSLFGILTVGLIVGMLAITACGNGGNSGGTATPTATIPGITGTPSATTTAGQQDIIVTSSFNAGHSHDVTISGADIADPPVGGKTIDTTYDGGHRHTITLTQQDYESISDGGEVTVTDSLFGSHTHTYVIQK